MNAPPIEISAPAPRWMNVPKACSRSPSLLTSTMMSCSPIVLRGSLQLFSLGRGLGGLQSHEEADGRCGRHDLPQQLQPLRPDDGTEEDRARHIAAWPVRLATRPSLTG